MKEWVLYGCVLIKAVRINFNSGVSKKCRKIIKSNQSDALKTDAWFITLTANWTEHISRSQWLIDSMSQVTGSIWILLIISRLTGEEMTHKEVTLRSISEVLLLLWPLKLSFQNINSPNYSQTQILEEYRTASLWKQPLQHFNHCQCSRTSCRATEVQHFVSETQFVEERNSLPVSAHLDYRSRKHTLQKWDVLTITYKFSKL